MILASSSSSSHSKRTPFTVPWVPTGIKTGVSITERLVVRMPVLASPSRAITCQSIGPILPAQERPNIRPTDGCFGSDDSVLVDQNRGRCAKHPHFRGGFVPLVQDHRCAD